jgi:hypothetical protein
VSGLLGDAARREPEPLRRDDARTESLRRPPPTGRNGNQASNYQR